MPVSWHDMHRWTRVGWIVWLCALSVASNLHARLQERQVAKMTLYEVGKSGLPKVSAKHHITIRIRRTSVFHHAQS